MTDERLQDIREWLEDLRQGTIWPAPWPSIFLDLIQQDIPGLLSEAERLRKEVATLQGIISDQQQESGLYDAGWNAALEAARLTVSGTVVETGPYYRLLDRIGDLRRP